MLTQFVIPLIRISTKHCPLMLNAIEPRVLRLLIDPYKRHFTGLSDV